MSLQKRVFYNELHVRKGWAFSEVTGGRAPSFHDLSVGEAPATSAREGNGGGGKFPSQISRRKDQPGSLGTQEKAQPFLGSAAPRKPFFQPYKRIEAEQ